MTTKQEPRSPGPAASTHGGRKRLTVVGAHARGALRRAISTAGTLVSHMPATIESTRAGANAATGAFQTLPDSTLRGLAGTSIGLAAGLYFARVPRAVTAAAVAPAFALGWAMLVRPRDQNAMKSQRAGATR